MDGVSHDELYPYAFKNKHWKGLLIEPVSDYFEQLKKNYENRENLIFENVAISDSSEQKQIYTVNRDAIQNGNVPFWCNGISTFNPNGPTISAEGIKDKVQTEIVKCCTFKDIVNKHHLQKIDILQIDAEGSDYDILNQIWNCGFRPKLIYIEIVHMTSEQVTYVQQLLQSNHYETMIQGDNILAIKNTTSNFVYSKRKRVAFYIYPQWAYGSIHSALCKELRQYDIDADILDWTGKYTDEEWEDFNRIYDLFVTTPSDPVKSLIKHHIPYEKIIAVAHGIKDIDGGLYHQNNFNSLFKYAAVSPSLIEYSQSVGIQKEMKLVRNGIYFDRFYQPISSNLSVIGYAGELEHLNFTNTSDCKRSHLVHQIIEKIQLPLIIAGKRDYIRMPAYYPIVDSIIVSSDYESCGLPLMESAAAGRLPISAKIGILNDVENPPGLILPLESLEFVNEGVEKIKELMSDTVKFQQMCQEAQDFAREYYDWSAVIEMWADLLTGFSDSVIINTATS